MPFEKGHKFSPSKTDFGAAKSVVKRKARLAVMDEGIQFYLDQARDTRNPAPFRKQCWDKLFDVGYGKPAQQKDKVVTKSRRILVTGLPSREKLSNTNPSLISEPPSLPPFSSLEQEDTYGNDETQAAAQFDMAEEEQDESYDQIDLERRIPLRDSAGFPIIAPPPG